MKREEPISPLTIIAIFAGIIEASALASLPFLSAESQTIYTWFLVAFPFFLTVLFFLTLNFNAVSLYKPDPSKLAEPSTAPAFHAGHDAAPQDLMTIALSGPDTRKTIEQHILRTLTHRPVRPRRWQLYNLDCRTCIHLSVRPLEEGEELHGP
ncbi:hypothetical protein P0Y43_10685 [Pseudomonas entomophila]|uniref:hypothetical protein n=1 Tax=Pseudomonas entomophila TaxID=312306 RepID=UPI0023D8B7EA|nr:hypothetical protein [Pseudomonas entomophila]MDF0731191.1 hypothetical protein [Pseudomonas entomophila]